MKSIKDILSAMVPYALILLSLIFALVYMDHNYYRLMNSDTSSELMLGELLANNGGMLSKEWIYSTELRVLNTQLIYKIGFLLFDNNWKLVRLLSNTIMLVALIVSYLFMTYSLGLKKEGKMTAWILVMPFSPAWGYMIVYGAFYIPHVAITFIAIGLLGQCVIKAQPNFRKCILSNILLCCLALISGFGGARQGLICFIPAILAAAVVYLSRYVNKANMAKEQLAATARMLFGSVAAFIFFTIGVIINNKLLSVKYYYRDQSAYSWYLFSLDDYLECLGEYLSLYGLNFNGIKFVSIESITNFCAIGLIMLVAVVTILACKNNPNYSVPIAFYSVFAAVIILFDALIFSLNRNNYNVTYWITAVPLVFPLIPLIFKRNEDKDVNKLKILTAIFVVFAVVATSFQTYEKPWETRLSYMVDSSKYLGAAEAIANLNCNQGFATFWMANMFTEMTNGKAELWTVDTEIDTMEKLDDISRVTFFLQKHEHTKQLPEGDFFVVMTNTEYENSPFFEDIDHRVYVDDFSAVYYCTSMDDYHKLVVEYLSSK